MARLAAEVAEHKRDPYTLIEEIARKRGQESENDFRFAFTIRTEQLQSRSTQSNAKKTWISASIISALR